MAGSCAIALTARWRWKGALHRVCTVPMASCGVRISVQRGHAGLGSDGVRYQAFDKLVI